MAVPVALGRKLKRWIRLHDVESLELLSMFETVCKFFYPVCDYNVLALGY